MGEEARGKRDSVRFGVGSPIFIFLAELGSERRVPHSSVARFQILPFAVLGPRWSARARARAWLPNFQNSYFSSSFDLQCK